ncbi:MAG: hypothetical protein J6V11_03860 [Alphaproteobacteria bacterium]|nr:hypothetical protein [Alphaproteobacteria bacterium]
MKKFTLFGLFVCLLAVSIGFAPTVWASETPQNTEENNTPKSIWANLKIKNPDTRIANDTKAIQGLNENGSSSLGGSSAKK